MQPITVAVVLSVTVSVVLGTQHYLADHVLELYYYIYIHSLVLTMFHGYCYINSLVVAMVLTIAMHISYRSITISKIFEVSNNLFL